MTKHLAALSNDENMERLAILHIDLIDCWRKKKSTWPEALHGIGGIVIFHPLMLGQRRARHPSGISEREWFLEMSSHCEKIELAICGHCRQIIFIANAAFEHHHDDTCKFVAAEICLRTPIQQQRRLIVSTLHDLPVRGRKYSSVSI
ncbi:MAG: hypothetical protein AAAC48_00445 [Phyllobacterium sp.]